MSEDALQVLQSKMHLVQFQRGEYLCHEGDLGDRMYLVTHGEISVLKQDAEGKDIEVAVLKTGEIAGMLSLLRNEPRSASMVARGDLGVWEMDSTTFNHLLSQHPSFAQQLVAELSKYLRNQTALLADLQSSKQDSRYQIAVFDSKPYMEKVLTHENAGRYALHFYEVKLTPDTVSLAAGARAVCVFVNDQISEDVVIRLKHLGVELIALRCAGFNNVDLIACRQYGIRVVRVPAYSPHAVAEHSVALMMALNRRIHQAYNRIRDGNFSLNNLVGFDMHGKTVGVIGTGKIGSCAVNILLGFGCKVLVYNRSTSEDLKAKGAIFTTLDHIYREADIVSLYLPLDPSNRHLIGRSAIAKMKPGVMIINTSRGALVDTQALIAGLIDGRVGSAGLDVVEEEGDYFFEDFSSSIIKDDALTRLLSFNNVVVTGHMGFLTNEALSNIAECTFSNVTEFVNSTGAAALQNEVTSAA